MNTDRQSWQAHLTDELSFWERYIGTRGHAWPDEFAQRVDPEAPLAEMEIVSRVGRGRRRLRILDVGAGPLTILGKRLPGVAVEIMAVDPLAKDYNGILDRHGIVPPVRTEWCEGEALVRRFGHNGFDFAYARNALDHAHDPCDVIRQMVTLTRPGGWVILRHRPNEADSAGHRGLHQWNFQLRDGHFWIAGGTTSHDMTAELDHVAATDCRMDGPWLVCAIRKRRRHERLLRRLIGR